MHRELIGKDCNRCYILDGILQNQCIDMVNVHGIIDESRHSSWAGFLKELGNLQEHKIREHRECLQSTSLTIKKEHSEENSECEKPGLFVTIMDEINIGQ